MESIAQCGDHLRLSADGTHLCTDCPDGAPVDVCCKSNASIASQISQPINDCGLLVRTNPPPDPPVIGRRRYCLLEAIATVDISAPSGTTQAGYFGTYSGVCELVNPVTVETGITPNVDNCAVVERALCRFRLTNVRNGETRSADYEYCGTFRVACPPIGTSSTISYVDNSGQGLLTPAGFSMGGAAPPQAGASEFGTVVSFNPVSMSMSEVGFSAPTTAQWTSDGRDYIYTARFVARSYSVTTGSAVDVGEMLVRARFRVSHDLTCDDQPSPHEGGCPDLGGPCLADPEAYLISEPCDPAYTGPAVVFNAENVAGCAVIPTAWGCVKISPQSPAILNPSNINAVIDNRVVPVGVYPTTCCECVPGCPNQPIVPSPCWAGGVRNGITGAWAPNTPFVTEGPCCCNPDDLITITEADSLWVTSGLTFHRFLDAPVVVRRGDTWRLPMTERVTDTATGAFIQDVPIVFGTEFDPIAPFECSGGPWSGSVNAQGFGPANLQIPEGFVGLHHAATDGGVRDMPCPIDSNGGGNGVTVLSKNVSVTCTTFFYDGAWEWNGGPTAGGSRVTHRLRLSITPAPNSQRPECSGGCGQTGGGGPVAGPGGPGAPTPFPGGPGIGGVLGGCGGCGRDGGL